MLHATACMPPKLEEGEEGGKARGTAAPSAHVTGTVCQWSAPAHGSGQRRACTGTGR